MDKQIPDNKKNKMKDPPKWVEDFPVDMEKDTHVARRDFIRFLSIVSFGLFTGTAAVYTRSLMIAKKALKITTPVRIVGKEDLAVGESYVFQTPDDKGPAILIHLSAGQYVAYSQKCTHLQCPVIWKAKESKLFCPCHHGAFAVENGDVLYGPPERPLPKIELEMKKDGIYYKGMALKGATDHAI